MSRHLRTLIIVAGCLVLALDVAALGYAFTRGGEAPLPKYPGRIAVRDGCGVQHMFFDGTDKQELCLQGIFDDLSVSRNGEKLAWDTKDGNAILVSGVDGANPINAPLPTGFEHGPEPGARRRADRLPALAARRRPVRHLGHLDHRSQRGAADEHAQRLRRRVVPDGGLDRVRPELVPGHRGGAALARPYERRGRAHARRERRRARAGHPTGSTSPTCTTGSIWVADSDGSNAHQVIPDGRAPAWSRDNEMIAFTRTEKCSRNVCPERLMLGVRERDRRPRSRAHVSRRAPRRLAPRPVRVGEPRSERLD